MFSKFARARPVKTKTGEDTTAAMDSILEERRKSRNLQFDKGKEF